MRKRVIQNNNDLLKYNEDTYYQTNSEKNKPSPAGEGGSHRLTDEAFTAYLTPQPPQAVPLFPQE